MLECNAGSDLVLSTARSGHMDSRCVGLEQEEVVWSVGIEPSVTGHMEIGADVVPLPLGSEDFGFSQPIDRSEVVNVEFNSNNTRGSCHPVISNITQGSCHPVISNNTQGSCHPAISHITQGSCHPGQSKLLKLHEAVKKSGKSNIAGVRIPLESRWNSDYLARELVDYQDKEVAELCRFGWPISIVANATFKERAFPRNWRSALEYAEQLDRYVEEELQAGTLLGPFEANPFSAQAVVSPLSTAEKRDSNERRVIMDLSFPHGDSVNDKIPRDQYLGQEMILKYPGVDALVELVKKKGPGCALVKVDLRRAYKQIFTDPSDWNFLGLRWQGKLLFDRTMPMGLRSAAMCCQRITNAFKFMVEKQGFDLVSYLDDMVSAETWALADKCLSTIQKVVRDSGAEEAEAKTVHPTCVMLFLGILFNTISLTLEISQDRLVEIQGLLEKWLKKSHVTRKEVEVMVGKLAFVASVVRPGRLFVSRLLEFMRGMPQVGKFVVTDEFRKDLLWWQKFLPHYNGVSMMALESWSRPDEIFATDACLIGCGGWYCEKQEYFHAEFPAFIANMELSINALELLTIVVAAKVWGRYWRGRRIVVHCDNEVSVTVMNTGRAHNTFLQSCLRELEFAAAKGEFEIRGNHIPGIENRIPDALSRWQDGAYYREQFRAQVRGLDVREMFVYEGLFEFVHDW